MESGFRDGFNWKEITCPDSGPRAFHSSILYDDFIVTIGGFDGHHPLDSIIVLDLNTNQWEKINSTNSQGIARYGHSSCLYKDKIILFGGYRDKVLNDVGVITIMRTKPFEIEYETIQTTNGTRFRRYRHTAHIYEEKMYVFGGFQMFEQDPVNTLLCLDLNNFNWKKCEVTGDVPGVCYSHGSALYNGDIYIFGGQWENCGYSNNFFRLEIKTMKYTKINSMNNSKLPSARSGLSMQQNDGKIYIFGGQYKYSYEYYNDLYLFDTENSSWLPFTGQKATITPKSDCTLTFWRNNLIVWGGRETASKFSSGIYSLLLNGSNYVSNSPVENKLKFEMGSYLNQMKELFQNPILSDVCFLVEGQEFQAHKVILATRCQYFKNMLNSGMSESQSHKIPISDVKAATFRSLLEILYCSETDVTDQLALELLELSDKWNLPEISAKCQKFLANQITKENLNQIYKVANIVGSYMLLDKASEFVIAHLDKYEDDELLSLPPPILVKVIRRKKNL